MLRVRWKAPRLEVEDSESLSAAATRWRSCASDSTLASTLARSRPSFTLAQLQARFGKREEAKEEEDEEKDVADNERIEQLARRQVRPTRTHNDEVKQLLKLMGIPCVTAPSEAEAQCAELCRAGKVYAAGSEDMDTVTFATPILLRHLTFSEAKKMPVHEVNLDKVLEGMNLTMDQFIDLCILLGCDYLEPVKGIGPKTAFKLIKDHGNIEAIREHLEEREKEKAAEAEKKGKDRPRGVVFPEVWPFEEARKIFKNPDVIKADDMELKWEHPDVEGLVKFLCTDKGFSEDRVRKGAEKLTKALGQKQQGRLDGFFKVQQAPKRKAEDEPSSSKGAKGGKGGKGSDSKASGSKKKK